MVGWAYMYACVLACYKCEYMCVHCDCVKVHIRVYACAFMCACVYMYECMRVLVYVLIFRD